MACEELAANYDAQMALIPPLQAAVNEGQLDQQQRQWALMAQQMAVAMAGMLWQMCLAGQGGFPGGQMMQMAEAVNSPEKLKAKLSELQQLRSKKK